jgi:patatin-like phospholipase/acyl hydrolase
MSSSYSPFRILSLDGGGAKGVYSLGFLGQLEIHLDNGPLCNSLDLVYGTSTGAIIAALIGLGRNVREISDLYFKIVPDVMPHNDPAVRSARLQQQANDIFGDRKFDQFKTRVAIVTTNYDFNRPTIFKSDIAQTYTMKASFQPGFGCSIAEATLASSAAAPFFEKRTINTENHGRMTLVDGGFVANNPTLFALTDATSALGVAREHIRVLSLGVGRYAQARMPMNILDRIKYRFLERNFPVEILDLMMSSNANATEILVRLLFPNLAYERINEPFIEQGFETHFLESDLRKLGIMENHGRSSFSAKERDVMKLFGG